MAPELQLSWHQQHVAAPAAAAAAQVDLATNAHPAALSLSFCCFCQAGGLGEVMLMSHSTLRGMANGLNKRADDVDLLLSLSECCSSLVVPAAVLGLSMYSMGAT